MVGTDKVAVVVKEMSIMKQKLCTVLRDNRKVALRVRPTHRKLQVINMEDFHLQRECFIGWNTLV